MTQKDALGKTPSGMAGLMRYEEDSESKLKLDPKIVVFACVAIIILEALMIYFLPV
jgi:preprotein translocase subunit Sec61beta